MPYSSDWPCTVPPLMPPPAIHDEKHKLWCSRPAWSACIWNGVRPNSVVHTTSVRSSMPLCLRSVSNPAMGLSMALASRSWSPMSPCESQFPLDPTSINSRKRTPRSASLRATKHCQPKPLVAPRSSPYRRSVSSVSCDRSNASGASRCMPNAVSKDRILASSD